MPFAYAAQALEKLGAAKESAEFERIAQSLAQTVTPPPRPAPLAAATSGEAPAWHLLERGVHLETLDRDYAPTGLLEQIEPAPRRVLDVGCVCGGTGRWLKRRFPGCQVVGIEMLPEAAAIAERIRSLGHPAPATYAEFGKLTSIQETPGQPKADEMVRLLVEGNEAVVRTARTIFPSVEKANDEPTADLLTQRMQIHEKNAWMLRSLLEG
jgi:hypothetical protein